MEVSLQQDNTSNIAKPGDENVVKGGAKGVGNDTAFLMDTPLFVPQSNAFEGEKFYIRECYPEYYSKILQQLKETRLMSVTGTPGIGKSIFYLYFYNRYRQQHPNERVLTASFTKKQELKQCFVWKSSNEMKQNKDQHAYEEHQRIPTRACRLYLYDGPPNMEPLDPTTVMVAFPSPNADWMSMTSKYEHHMAVYMPNWTCVELGIANDALGLGLQEQHLEQKASLFGGTAHYSLTQSEYFFKVGKNRLSEALSNITSVHHVKQCFEKRMDLDKVVHRLMHYFVSENDWTDATLKPASKLVACLIHQSLERKLHTERNMLMHWLDGTGKASVFCAWLFENFAHEEFLEGGDYVLASLETHQTNEQLSIDGNAGHYKRFKLNVPVAEALLDTYQIPEASNLQSIDSYIQTNDALWMFQMTLNFEHTIDLEGILKILQFLQMEKKVKADPTFAKLVFVVPSRMVSKFRKQVITMPAVFQGKSHEQVMNTDCIEMPGIGPEKRRKLNSGGIQTIGQVLEACRHGVEGVSFIRCAAKKFNENLIALKDARQLENIPQCVVGLDYSRPENIWL